MVDCRPAGAPPHDLAHSASNGAPPENHHNQVPASSELPHAMPASARASTPATTNAITTYAGMNPPGMNPPGVYSGAGNMCQYVCGVKSVVWCAPPQAEPPPPPHQGVAAGHTPHCGPPPPGVNPHVHKSMHANGADLPMNDIATLRYYFNLGVECMWATYGPPPPLAPPRHYSPRALAMDMQQISLQDRPGGHDHNKHNNKPNDKPQLNNKGNGQRPLLGPRFKRGGNNQEGQNNNHNQNKAHNNNMPNKGPNNRRNSHGDGRGNWGEEVVVEPGVLTVPYIPYPPPLYPIPYYPVDADPAMMGMMGGMGYVGYEEGVEYGAPLYYPPPPHPAHPHYVHNPHNVHHEHK